MVFRETKIAGVYIIETEEIMDERGFFERIFSLDEFEKHGIKFPIVQINGSLSKKKGIIRGIHMQRAPYTEDKFTQCLEGAIFDVAVDLRKESKTYGQWIGEVISNANKKMMLIPKGCARGFQALEDNSIVQYAVSQYYSPQNEMGIRWNDPYFKISWPIQKATVSKKDAAWPLFSPTL